MTFRVLGVPLRLLGCSFIRYRRRHLASFISRQRQADRSNPDVFDHPAERAPSSDRQT